MTKVSPLFFAMKTLPAGIALAGLLFTGGPVQADPIPPTTIGFHTASGSVGSYYNGGTDAAGNSGPNVGIVANTANAAGGGVLNGGSNPTFSVPSGFTGGFSVEAINVAVGFAINVYDGENGTGTLIAQQGFSLNGNTTASVTFAGTAKSVVLAKWSGSPNYDNLTFGSATLGTPVAEPPGVTTSAATGVTATTATLNATVNPGGATTTAQFEYGTNISYGSTASVTLSPANGTNYQSVSANLTGLLPGTTYNFRITGTNSAGSRNGGNLTFTTAVAGTALHFDGINDSVDIAHTPGQISYPFTVEAWVKTTDADGIVVSKYVGSSGNGWQMGMSGGKLAAWFFRPGGTIFPSGAGIVGATTINNGAWHHVAFVVDSTGGRLFVDGVSDGFSGWTTGTPGPATTTAPLRLGNETTGFLYPFAGTLDEVRIWSVARTAAELQANKNAELAVMPPCLVGYYKFNQGTADGNNAGVTTLADTTGGASGTLNNFALTGTTGNWTTGSGITEVASVQDPAAPEINLTGNAASIVLGDSTPDPADHTDFGSALVTGGTVVRTFTVQNTGPGASALNVSSVAVSGTHAADFTVGTLTPASPVAGGTSATFTVTFDPSAAGVRSATITVNNDDCNEAAYTFAVQGTGLNTAPTVATDAGSKLFIARYITGNFIARANVDGSALNTTHFPLPNNAIGVTVDAVNGKLYWSSFTGGSRIGRMNLDGSGSEPDWLVGVHAIGMAVDTANGWLYLAGGAIKRVRLDGTGLTTLISGLDIPGFTSCSGVALDVPNNKLYYAFNTAIGRADLDGSNHTPTYVTTGGGAPPDDVAIDRTNGKLYWTISGANKIGRANVDGTGIQSAFLTVTAPRSLIVDPQASKVFWADGSGVGRANLDGTGVNTSFLAGVSGSWGIALGDVDTEGTQATRTGTYSDADGNTVTFSASVGSVTKTGTSSGTWTWTYTPPDGPATHNVTITANDGLANSTTSFTLNVNNVAPTATFSRSAATANENTVSPPNVSFTVQTDPGTTDVSTGLKYSYDFNNDGVWDDGDGTYAGSLTAATKTIPASYFASPAPSPLVVKGRILDKDGGLTDYTVSITINHAPTAINGPLTIVEDFDYGASGGTLSGNGGAGFSSAWSGGNYSPAGLTFSSLTSPGGAWVGGSGSRNFAASLAAAGPISGDFLFSMNSAPPGRVQMFGLGGFNNQGFTIALAPANDSTPTGGIPIVGLNSGGYANITAGAVALNTTYMYRFSYAGSSITAWILTAAQYDNFAPDGLTDAELNAASIGGAPTQVTGRVTKTGNVTGNMANLFTYTFGGDGVTMDRLRMTGMPVGASLVVAENAAINTSAGTLTASDADSGNTFTFALVSGAGDTDNASFTISGNTVRSAAVFDYETKSSYSIRVRVTDQGGLSYETPLAVTIANVNEAVTDLVLSPASIAENNATNATVGTLTATDGDTGDTHTFTLVGGVGSADNGSFTIAGSALRLTPSADFETKNSYALRIRATDVGGLFFEKALTVTITDVGEDTPPVVTRDNATVTTGEGLSALNSGTYSDANGNATVTLTASIGTLTTNIGAGTWSWIYTPADGPDAGTNVIITANDGVNGAVTTSFTLIVTNRAPKLNQCTPPSFTLVTTTIPGWAAAPGDLDGDGDQDIVMGYPGGGISPVPFRNNGNATFTQMPTLPGAARVVLTPLLADYNGDGLLDVAVDQGSSYRVFFGNGAFGTFSNVVVGSGGAEASGSVADLNADGRPDFVVGINRGNSDNNGQVSVRLNNGSGSFPTITQYFVGPGEIFVTTADFNNDGKPDIAAADSETNTVTILLNNGSGGFTFAPGGPIAVGTTPKQLTAGDFNNDGFRDLAVPNSGAGTVTILLGNGSGGFTSAGTFTAGAGAKFVLAADFNNDGVLDLGVALTSGVALLAGNGGGSFGAPTVYGTGFSPINITLADMNADGGQDILVGFSDTVRYLQANVAPTTVSVNEGSTATNNGSFCDPGVDTVTVSTSLGTVTQGSSTWGWSYSAADGPLTTNVTITATDSDGATSTYTFVLVVNNLAPTLSRLLASVTTGEALTVTNGGGFRDAGVDDVSLFANVGIVTTNGTNWTWSYVPTDGPLSTNVVITIVDSDNFTNTTTFTLTVTNRAPTIALTGNSSVAAGTSYTLNLGAVTDAGMDTVTNYSINWGDGNTESFSGHPTGLGKTHTFATAGSKTISVSLTDEDGTFASAGTKVITVTSLVASNLTVTRGRGVSLKIRIADLARDLNSVPVSVQSLGESAQGATLTHDSTRIFYTPANDNNDSFTYVVGNGSLTATGTVTVIVSVSPGGLAQTISVSGGAATVKFFGIPGYQYDVQRATSLAEPVTWTTLSGEAITAGTNGVFTFADTNAPNGAAFYRSAQR